MKRIFSVYIVLLCMVALYHMAERVQTAPMAIEPEEITVSTMIIEPEKMTVSTITIEPKGRKYTMDFVSSGMDYSVTVTDTMETYRKGDQEYSIFDVSLYDKNENVLQQFTCDVVRRHILDLKCDDLNFDGFPDLEIGYSRLLNKTNYCYVYLWDAEQEIFKDKPIHIPLEYEMYENEKVFTVVSHYPYIEERAICRINEEDEMEELRYWISDYENRTEVIGERGEEKIIYEENDDGWNSFRSSEYYEEIFWSDLFGDCQKYRTYWTIEVDDYKICLQDFVPDESLKLVFFRDDDEKILHVYDLMWGCRPVNITADTFKNLLGHNGFSICYSPSDNQYYTYYYAIEEGKLIYLADSWGREQDNYMVDIDKDGVKELICNVEYLGDGARHALIYYNSGQEIWHKWGDGYLDEEYDDHGTGSIYCQYLPEKNVVSVHFWKDDLNDYKVKEYEVKLDKPEESPYSKDESG